MITSLIRTMSFDQLLSLKPGTKIVLHNNTSRHPNYPLSKYKVGDVFTVQGVYYNDDLIFPAIILKEEHNPYERDAGGFCASRFGLWKNPKIYNVGGNL